MHGAKRGRSKKQVCNAEDKEFERELGLDTTKIKENKDGRGSVSHVNKMELEKIEDAVNLLSETDESTRMNSLKYLEKAFQKTFFNLKLCWTYTDILMKLIEKNCIKGKDGVKIQSFRALKLLILQIGPPFINSYKREIHQLCNKVSDSCSTSNSVKEVAISVIPIIYHLSSDEDLNDIKDVRNYMNFLEIVFQRQEAGELATQFKIVAVESWGHLFTQVPSKMLMDVAKHALPIILRLLRAENVNLRISAGNLLPMIYERVRLELNQSFYGNTYETMIKQLEELARENNKDFSKCDRLAQRKAFRDIFSAITDENFEPEEETIEFGNEVLNLENYTKKCHYDIYRKILANGTHIHLMKNVHVRQIFGLCEPDQGEDGSENDRDEIAERGGRTKGRKRDHKEQAKCKDIKRKQCRRGREYDKCRYAE